MRLWVRNIGFLLLVGSTLGNVGLLSGELYRLVALLSFLIFVGAFWPATRVNRDTRPPAVAAAIVTALVGLGLARFANLGLFYFYLFLSIALAILVRRRDVPDVRQWVTYVIALSAVGVLAELVRLLPALWHLQVGMAHTLSAIAGTLAREDRNLGPTAMALPLLVSLVVLVLVREAAAERPNRLRAALTVLVLVAAHLFYLWGLKYYARWTAVRPGWDWMLLNSQHLFLILGGTVYTLIDRGRPMRALGWARRALYPTALTLVVGLGAAIALGWAPPPAHHPARVMIYDAGYVNWRIPVHGFYGEHSAGMFGMLPSTLEAVGFDVVVSDDIGLLNGPDPPDCVVMINIQDYLDAEEKRGVLEFIAAGGGLLCLGDHTGVAGIRGPFNDLLEPIGIRFRFDSSTFLGHGWNDALVFRNHPMNRGVESAEDYQIWVGATLDLDSSANPVVVGRYGYSDIGNPANIERAYLGDRRYNPDELLGDVVLVADARYGRGRVMVFGDTSGYQNLSFARSLDTVARSLDYLGAGGGFTPSLVLQWAALVVFLVIVLGSLFIAGSPLPLIAAVVGLALGSSVIRIATPPPPRIIPRFVGAFPDPANAGISYIKRDLAVLDVSHGGHFTLRAWNPQSVGTLQLNLARSGYFPIIRDTFPYAELEGGAKLLIIVAPCRSYGQDEIAAIEHFLKKGGQVIVTVGFEEITGARGLLDHFGFSIASSPLGRFSVPTAVDTLPIEFHEAWPVQFREGAADSVLATHWGVPLAVSRGVGRGELIVIGDSSFFHDVNLESLNEYFAGNVDFLRRLIEVGMAP